MHHVWADHQTFFDILSSFVMLHFIIKCRMQARSALTSVDSLTFIFVVRIAEFSRESRTWKLHNRWNGRQFSRSHQHQLCCSLQQFLRKKKLRVASFCIIACGRKFNFSLYHCCQWLKLKCCHDDDFSLHKVSFNIFFIPLKCWQLCDVRRHSAHKLWKKKNDDKDIRLSNDSNHNILSSVEAIVREEKKIERQNFLCFRND